MSQIYSKTAKGQEEIKTRAGGLSQRMRQVLIFIDGKRSRDDLYGMLKGEDLDEQLAALAAQGLIEATGGAAPKPAATPAPAAPAAAPAAAAPKPAPAKAPEAPKATSEELERKRREEEEQAELLMARSFMGKMS
ncbi:hypothetical protein [Paucimonas lemoignei]|nr:hypothetical protein [Paucimonas lemoignei]